LCCSKYAEEIKAIVGTIDLTDPKSQHNVVKIIKHKGYNPSSSWINDIALLQVNILYVNFLFTQRNWDLYNFLFLKIINLKQIYLFQVETPIKKSNTVGYVPLPPKDHVVEANDIAVVSGWGRLWVSLPSY